MVKIFLSTHGKMASGMLSSIELLYGDVSCLTVFDAYLNNEHIDEHVNEFLEKCDDHDVKILISDFLGGSVNHELIKYQKYSNLYILTGVNLPLLLALIFKSNSSVTKQELEMMINEAREMIQLVNIDESATNSENFFD